MAEQFLHRSNVMSRLQDVGREAVPQGMAADRYINPSGPSRISEGALEDVLVEVVRSQIARPWVATGVPGREQILPSKLGCSVWMLPPSTTINARLGRGDLWAIALGNWCCTVPAQQTPIRPRPAEGLYLG